MWGRPQKVAAKFGSHALQISLISLTGKGLCHLSGKKAVVVPIPKTMPANWEKLRPVSLTDHFAKLAEGFMAKWLMEDLESNIDPNQYGNMKGVSTSHYLVNLMDT